MEIKLTDKHKIVIEGIIRSGVFLVVMREYDLLVFDCITGPIIDLISYIQSLVPDIDQFIHINQDIINIISIPAVILIFFAGFTFNTYVIAKFCGLFKYFSRFKFWKSFLILLTISYILNYFITNNIHIIPEKYIADDPYIPLTIIPSYLVYLFFNFLTKKFPTPFKQIGYFFSIEFYKDLFKKLLNKSKPSD